MLPDGTVESISARGLALGIDAPQVYDTVTEPFPPGAIVVVYTDGVIEARRGGEQFGVERLDALLAERRGLPPQEIAQAALAACRDWTGGELTDDFAVVVVKRSPQLERHGGMNRSQAALAALVFGAGIGSLATEIAASRMLAPYFGSSTIVWANLIGIVLAGLALGYWLGGKLADRRPERRLLGLIVLAAALWVAMTPFLARPFLDAAVGNLDDASAGAVIGSFFAVLLLFAPAVVLLGMVSPFAIRLAITDVESAGEVAGRFYALSTFGSLVGTFVPALILIPLVGTQRTLLATAALLAISASFLLGRKAVVLAAAIAALVALPPGAVKAEEGLLHEEDSLYQFIQVVERDDGRRLLRLNEGVAVHSVWRKDTVLTGGVWDAFLALPPLLDRPLRNVAILGNAGGTTARALGRFYPDAHVDGVELDPAVSRAGREYFGMEDNPNLTVYDADAQAVPPAYRRALRPDRRRRLSPAVRALLPRDARVLPPRAGAPRAGWDRGAQCRLSARGRQPPRRDRRHAHARVRVGRSVAGAALQQDPARVRRAAAHSSRIRARDDVAPELRPLVKLLVRQLRPVTKKAERPWTDDRAPVEWVTDRMIVEYAARGGELDEDFLPTRP